MAAIGDQVDLGGLRSFSPRTLRATRPASSGCRCQVIESVPTTEYMIAVNLAPSSLSSHRTISRRPMAGPRKNLSARLLSRRHLRAVDEHAQPFAMASAASAAPCPGAPGRAGRPTPGRPPSNRPSSASFNAPCAASNAERLALDHGVVMSQPRLVQAVDRRDPLDPSLAPVRQSHLAGRALDKIAAHMGPTECKGHLARGEGERSRL